MNDTPDTPARGTSPVQPPRPSDPAVGPGRSRFGRYLTRAIFGASFPLAGSIIVIYTLSGTTRRVAIIATMIAILGHIGHTVMDLTERDERFRSMRDDPGSQGAELRDLLD